MNESSPTRSGLPGETAPGDIVGRATELEAIDRFLDRLVTGPAAVVFEGQAGIGKTTVWREVLGRGERRSIMVLSCRPVEAEAKLAFASLADLLEPVANTVLPQLPEPQRLALEVALMRASPHGAPPSARAVATAALSALRLLVATSPVVLALDDQQWLDRASGEALAFALRRIGDCRVGVAAAHRVQENEIPDRLALDAAFPGKVERLRLGPLSLSGLHHMIRAHLGHVFSRPVLRRIADDSGGNPLFALELARSLIEAGVPAEPGRPLPVSDTLTSLVTQRLDRLPARARAALLVASALSTPTVELIDRVLGGDVRSALARAEQARVIETSTRQIRFAHPVLASAVYSSATPDERRDLHRRLADVIAAPEERARHLALAAAQPDETVACVLDEASLLARRRGAPDAAGDLQELAARLTPLDDEAAARSRRTAAAEHFFHAGDRAHARTLLEEALAERAVGRERAKALHLLGQIRGHEDSFADAIVHLAEALTHADAAERVPILLDLAFATFSTGDLARAISCASDALAEAELLGDGGLIADALCIDVMGKFMAGLGSDDAGLTRALALEDRTHAGQLLLRPTSIAGQIATYEGRLAAGEALLREMCDWARDRGEESELPFLLFHLSRLESSRGAFAAAARYADEAIMLSAQTGSENMRLFGLVWRATARAGCGDAAGARADLGEVRALTGTTDHRMGEVFLRATEGALELSLGDPAAAEQTLAPLVAAIEATGIAEPGAAFFLPDAIEALIARGQSSRAAPLLQTFAQQADRLDRRWALAGAARCRSLLEAAHGDLDAARTAAEDAVTRWEQLEMPVELGRALLVLGQVLRRRGERRAARDALQRAVALFRGHGARLWEERASDDLGRIPIRRGASEDLTPTEEQVAALAAAGRTNREIAGTLFMSQKTVEANLTRIYGKLGIRARAELGVAMLDRRETARPAKE